MTTVFINRLFRLMITFNSIKLAAKILKKMFRL